MEKDKKSTVLVNLYGWSSRKG